MLENQVAELQANQQKTASTVRALASTVARLAEGGTRQAGGQDEVSSTATGNELLEWGAWLIGHYELVGIPACWPRHGAIVEEFDALRVAWLASIGAGADGLAAVQWHDALGRSVSRINSPQARWRRCLDHGHRDAPEVPASEGDPAAMISRRFRSPSSPED